jgi:hypothetical protein
MRCDTIQNNQEEREREPWRVYNQQSRSDILGVSCWDECLCEPGNNDFSSGRRTEDRTYVRTVHTLRSDGEIDNSKRNISEISIFKFLELTCTVLSCALWSGFEVFFRYVAYFSFKISKSPFFEGIRAVCAVAFVVVHTTQDTKPRTTQPAPLSNAIRY